MLWNFQWQNTRLKTTTHSSILIYCIYSKKICNRLNIKSEEV